MIIYKAMNLATGMSYIGQTTRSLKERKSAHLKRAKLSNLKFYNAIRKYGEVKFSWMILKLCKTREELSFWEEFYISRYNTMTPSGYNLTSGGKGSLGLKHRKETRELLSRINSGENHPRYGIPCPEETKKKIGNANRGRKMSEDFGKQMSERLKKLWEKPDSDYRKRQFIARSIAQKGKFGRKNGNAKKYIFIDPNNKTHFWDDGFERFCKIHQLVLSSMQRVLANKYKQGHHKGWKVKYQSDDLKEVLK